MLTVICKELRNWFDIERLFGEFEISNGMIDLTDYSIQDGQYFRIIGSVFNDGVYQYPATELTNETFDGAIWLMAVPKYFLDLVERISDWQDQYAGTDSVLMSPYQSESFGGYSYSKSSTGTSAADSSATITWRSMFAGELNRWRKI